MRNAILTIITLMILLPNVNAVLDMCENTLEINSNCTMLTPELSCASYTYEIFNTSGYEVNNGSLSIVSDDIYYLNFTEGSGDYIVKLCDGSTREIRVKSEDENKMIIAAIIILPLLFGLILLLSSAFLSDKHPALKISLFLLSIVTFWVSLHFGLLGVVKFYDFPELENLIGTTTYWSAFVFFVIMSYFAIYLIYLIFIGLSKRKREQLYY